MLLLLLFFFCKYPATTEIYTYGHTRSLHDALPICRPRRRRTRTRARGLCARCRDPAAGPGRRTGGASRVRGAAAVPPGGHDPRVVRAAGLTVHLRWLPLQRGSQETSTPLLRSEEHTSELQSLMRISYAVFCVKKKQKRQQ